MLALWPRAARPVSLPRLGRAGNALTQGRPRAAADRQGERPLLWIVLPWLLFGLLLLIYFMEKTLETGANGWRFPFQFRTLKVVLSTRVLTGEVAISTIAIAVPILLFAPRDPIRELAP